MPHLLRQRLGHGRLAGEHAARVGGGAGGVDLGGQARHLGGRAGLLLLQQLVRPAM